MLLLVSWTREEYYMTGNQSNHHQFHSGSAMWGFFFFFQNWRKWNIHIEDPLNIYYSVWNPMILYFEKCITLPQSQILKVESEDLCLWDNQTQWANNSTNYFLTVNIICIFRKYLFVYFPRVFVLGGGWGKENWKTNREILFTSRYRIMHLFQLFQQ